MTAGGEANVGRSAGAASALQWCGLVGIATIAVMRSAIFFAPQLVFDVDPAFDPEPLGGLGPAGSLWLDALLLVACGCGLLGLSLARRGVEPWLLALALAPLPVVLWHGAGDAGDLWRGATWATAALAAVVVAHLARDRRRRRLLTMLLLAAALPLLARGFANVTYEYADNVRAYEENKEAILDDKGWEEGSAFAKIFERRLEQRQPAGWFVTTNIYASLMAVAVIAWLGLAIASARAGLTSGWSGLAGLLALAAAVGLWMTGSKGAVAAALGGVVLLVAPLLIGRLHALVRRFGPAIAVAALLAALAGVALRGAVLPESFAGEKSLLFRWHYAVSSSRILRENPLVGVGPDGYQPAYMLHRVARNPEEVASAHSMFCDWLCALGLVGSAWIALVAVFVARAGGGLRERADDTADDALDPADGRMGDVGAVVAVALLGLVPAIVFEARTLPEIGVAVRLLGIAGFVGAAFALRFLVARLDERLVRWSLAAGAIALVVHGQIEMTFTQPGAVVWAMCLLGLAARCPTREGGTRAVRWGGVVAAAIAIAASVWITVVGAVPATRQELLMLEAAETLRPLAAVEDGRPDPAFESECRQQAAALLIDAHERMPTALGPRIAAGEQLEKAARCEAGERRIEVLLEALGYGRYCVDRGDRGRAAVLVIFIERMLARLSGEDAHAKRAVSLARWMTESDPNGLHAWRRYGDTLWEAGRRDGETVKAYRRTLEIDEDFELDPLKRLPERDLEQIEARLRELAAGGDE